MKERLERRSDVHPVVVPERIFIEVHLQVLKGRASSRMLMASATVTGVGPAAPDPMVLVTASQTLL
jgi:hypothetical protein